MQIWWILAILSVVALIVFYLTMKQINKLEKQKTRKIKRILQATGTIVQKYDKIEELFPELRNNSKI